MSKIFKSRTRQVADARVYKKTRASSKKSHKEMTLEYMTLYGSITPREALDAFGCMRLSGRIGELRDDGYDILTITGDKNKNYATYVLEGEM